MNYEVKPGKTLDGRFKITDLIGRGGTACVYEAIDCSTGDVVAVKVPHLRCESDPSFYRRFEREEAIGTGLRHPGIVRVIAVEGRSRPYIVMERLEGRLLSDRLAEEPRPGIAESVGIASRIADALGYIHSRDVVHRDLKPSNVMLCPDGTIRLIDLGLAKGRAYRAVTVFGFSPVMGTPDYLSPEQAGGRGGDERSDVYSLGAVLYKMVTGQVPFPGADPISRMTSRLVGDPLPPRTLNPDVSEGVEEIILHAMERDPGDRYQSAAELKADLDCPERVLPTGRASRATPPGPWSVRWRRARPLVLAVAATLAGFGAFYAACRLAAGTGP